LKRIIFIAFLSILLASPQAVRAQGEASSAVPEAMKKCDISGCGKYFNDMVDLDIPGTRGSFGKVQAMRILGDYLTSKCPGSLTVSRQGESPGGSRFVMGSYFAYGKKNRFYITLRKSGGEFIIFAFQIQEE
jgi:hypothetical protein